MSVEYADHQEKISAIYEIPGFLLFHVNQKLIEFGCGVGALTRLVGRQSPLTQITAMDFNPQLIFLAQQRFVSEGLKNIHFLRGDLNSPRLVSEISKYLSGS